MSDKERKPTAKGKPPKPAGTRPGSRTDDLAFDNIIEAILGATPEAIREHQKNRVQKRKQKPRRDTGRSETAHKDE